MIQFACSDSYLCSKYLELYNRCFKKYPSTKNNKYLNWLYNEKSSR